MPKERILILDKEIIDHKLQRMAYQIWEHNSKEKEIILIGIEKTGTVMAKNLAARLKKISPLKVEVVALKLNKKEPLNDTPELKININNKSVILVDDVANSGKTLLYALSPLLQYEPKKIQVAVLVDRKHKSFPVSSDIVGHSVATTLQEHIEVEHKGDEIIAAYLQ
jgi:pyrimidine operon attenuation protein/uracil phosphoribosyltransferase